MEVYTFLADFIQLPLSPAPTSGDHIYDLFSYEFVFICFWNMFGVQH